jgi:hypothetical protein
MDDDEELGHIAIDSAGFVWITYVGWKRKLLKTKNGIEYRRYSCGSYAQQLFIDSRNSLIHVCGDQLFEINENGLN